MVTIYSSIVGALLAVVGVAHGFSTPVVGGGVVVGLSSSSIKKSCRRESRPPPLTRQQRESLLLGQRNDDDDCNDSGTLNDDAFHHHGKSRQKQNPFTTLPITTNNNSSNSILSSRHHFLSNVACTFLLPTLLATTTFPNPSYALVKGNAPPPKMKPSSSSGSGSSSGNTNEGAPKCRNVEECQEMAERAEMQLMQREAEKAALGPKPQIVNGRTRYLDIVDDEDGASATSGSDTKVAKVGDTVTIYYKVLKLGKRSYDGLSGEGTVVFSRGYALEDDEKIVGDKSFTFTLGDTQVIQALNDAIPGMTVGSTRRISVTPQSGWEKNTPSCDGGPGGKGTGGELRTDYVVVPTATMVEQEACFDRSKLPFPSTYAQERRMAQRFDQSLIVEVKLVNVA
ncbi:hypothetical protein ACHAWU_007362 [Discostella pseudostelligera]|uniref:peptidylprolyl isomerase n=1 Tax=Discostella pseudostelligera TaxID=259834 RepID=A0ABD3MJH2_9STRA